jgi:hypothetical protein
MERVSWLFVSNLSSYDPATPLGSYVTATASIRWMNPTLPFSIFIPRSPGFSTGEVGAARKICRLDSITS